MTMYRPVAIGRPFESTDGGADLVVPFGRGVAGVFGGDGVAGSPAVGAGSADTSGVASGDDADDVGSGAAVAAGTGGVLSSGLAAGSTAGVGSAADTGDTIGSETRAAKARAQTRRNRFSGSMRPREEPTRQSRAPTAPIFPHVPTHA
jgi:hypothetical protein